MAHFEIKFVISEDTIPALEVPASRFEQFKDVRSSWDRSLTVTRHPDGNVVIAAGGLESPHGRAFAAAVVDTIRESASVHYLSLDADRAYPKVQVGSHEIGQAFERDWETTNKQSSFRITRNLYDEWFRFLIGKEEQANNRFIQTIRLARDARQAEPVFVDQFESYKNAVRQVLPHLLFLGVDPQKREIRFDSTGTPLSFDQLSGGEREIAFLVGQIERFSLRKGLLLVDEPELHLNYDLLRSWIGFLKSSVEQGQIWLATHSLEVVEVTGQDATFLLQRDQATRRVNVAASLSTQPIVATLSRAVGSPAFSIGSLTFVLVEGEEEIGERERFRLLCDAQPHIRFIEARSCKEVVRRIVDLKQLAAASGQPIRIGGVVDQDWRAPIERQALSDQGVFVLDVHEVENFFLDPATLKELVSVLGGDAVDVDAMVRDAADKRAGTWIFDAARTDRAFVNFPEPSKPTRELVHRLAWLDFADAELTSNQIASSDQQLTDEQRAQLAQHLLARVKIYEKKRVADVWRVCEGKEVFRSILGPLGFSDEAVGERAICAIWQRRPDLLPAELVALRRYVAGL